MNRREKAEQDRRQKFTDLGLNEKFEFIRIDWESPKGKKVFIRCRTCGEVFNTWALSEVIKGRQKHLLCLKCGVSSDGNDIKARSPKVDEAMAYYAAGHSVTETAEKFGVTKANINNWVKVRGITNGSTWRAGAALSNKMRHEAAVNHAQTQGIKYYRRYGNIKYRAKKHGCEIKGKIPSVRKLYELYNGKCCICGKTCDFNSRTKTGIGDDYPTRGHIKPSALGGELSIKNLWLLCNKCNRQSGIEDETHLLTEGGWQWQTEQKRYVQV